MRNRAKEKAEQRANMKLFKLVITVLGEKVVFEDVNADEYSMVVMLNDLGVEFKQFKEVGMEKFEVWAYLEDIPKHYWARHAFDKSCKADHVTNNMSETWNSSLGVIRGQPIVTMFEGIRRKVMTTIAKRRADALALRGELPPLVFGKLQKVIVDASNMKREWCGDRRWEVKASGKMFIVDLDKESCDCGLWSISGFPCPHAVKCLNLDRCESAMTLVAPKYKTASYRQTYSTYVMPIPDRERWEDIEIELLLPPDVKKQPGRPKNARTKEPGSPINPRRRGSIKCGSCGEWGHNSRGCKRKQTKENNGVKQVKTMADPSTSTIQAQDKA